MYRRRIVRLGITLPLVAVASVISCQLAYSSDEVTKSTSGSDFMEETTSEKDPRITWQVLQRGLEKVQQGRLDEVDQWLMYAMRNGSSDPLLESAESVEFLAAGLRQRSLKGAVAPQQSDIRVLQALLQLRFSNQRTALESFRLIAKDFPKHHAIVQIQQRINSLDSVLNPPKLPEPKEMSPEELQQALARIATEKVARAKSLKTFAEALQETKQELVEQHSRWQMEKFPLKVFVPPEGTCAQISGYTKGDRDSLVAAFQLWQKTMNNRIKFIFVPPSAKADITCEWVDHPDKLGSKSKDVVGTCSFSTGSNYLITKAHIRILTFSTKHATTFDTKFRHQYLKNIALHEIGHALGLDHLKDKNAIMYFQVQYPLTEMLSSADCKAMEAIVGLANLGPRFSQDEADVVNRGIDIERDLPTARDLERFKLWDQANSIYARAFKYRPDDESIRQATCRTALRAGRVMMKKYQLPKAIELLESAKLTMNAKTPLADRQQILDLLQAACELNNQQTRAAEVRALLHSGKF